MRFSVLIGFTLACGAASAEVASSCQEEGTEVSSHDEGLSKCCSSKSRTNNRCRGGVCEIHRYCCYYCPGDTEVGEAIAAPMSIVEPAQVTTELTPLVDVDAVLVPNLALAATAEADSTCQEEGTEVSSHNEGLAKCCSSKSRTNNRCRGGVCEIHRYCCYYCPGDTEVGGAIAAPMSIVEPAQVTTELTQLVDVDAVLVPKLALASTAEVDSTCQEEGTEVSSHNEGLAKCCSSKSRTNNRCRDGVCEIHRYCCYYCPGDMEVV